MDKSADEGIITIESDSNTGKFYSVNIRALTCNCLHFNRKLRALSIENPRRLCKHLVKALTMRGIPDFLKQVKEDIERCASYNSAFKPREEAIKTKQWDKRFPLPNESITTVSSTKKKKYCYLEGIAAGKKILATLPLNGGTISYTIGPFHGSYDLQTQASRIPWNYRYMEQALLNWLWGEYNKIKNAEAPTASPIKITYKQNPDPIHEGSIKTISTEKLELTSELFFLPGGTLLLHEDNEEYYHIVGEVDNNRVEAFISPQSSLVYYFINGSKDYIFDISPISIEEEVKLPDMETDLPMELTISFDLQDKFPKQYDFMERAVIKWLTDEHFKIKNEAVS